MSNLRGVLISKGDVGVSVRNLDGVSALLINAPAIAPAEGVIGITHGEVYELNRLKDALDYGINAAYDADNDVMVYRHISEFYRIAGDGTKLFIMLCDVAKDMATMISDHGHALVAGAKGEIRLLAVGYCPAENYAPVHVDGLEPIVFAAISEAQLLHDWSFDTDRPLNVIIEGRGITGLAAAIQNVRDIQVGGITTEYNNVSLCIGQDWDYAEGLAGAAKKMADIGTLLGTLARISVNNDPGEVGEEGDSTNLNLTNTKKLVWISAGLSNHQKITAVEDDLQTYNDKGYIFGISYTGVTGYRWNEGHVCAPVVVDDEDNMNVHSIPLGRTQNKLSRLIRKYLLPKVKSTVLVDTATGKLPTGMVKYFEGIGNKAFDELLSAGEISGGNTTVDPNSDLLSGDKELVCGFTMVPTGIVGQVSATVKVKKTL